MFQTLKNRLRLMRLVIQPLIPALAAMAFAANVNAQWSVADDFEGATLSARWNLTNGIVLRNTGGARGTRGFASLGGRGDTLEGKLAADAATVGLSDFYV